MDREVVGLLPPASVQFLFKFAMCWRFCHTPRPTSPLRVRMCGYVFIYVCMYVCMYVCVCLRASLRSWCVCVRACVRACVRVWCLCLRKHVAEKSHLYRISHFQSIGTSPAFLLNLERYSQGQTFCILFDLQVDI